MLKNLAARIFLNIPVIIGDIEPKTTNSKMWQNGGNKEHIFSQIKMIAFTAHGQKTLIFLILRKRRLKAEI